MSDNMERALGWDDEIENESPEFITLPAGEYEFEIEKFERGHFEPGPKSKLPACNKAMLTIRIFGTEGSTSIPHDLFLHSRTEGFLCAFFTSIGQRQKGEKKSMDWTKVPGARGRCKIKVEEYEKNGEKRTINKIDRFLAPDEGEAPKAFTHGEF